MKLARLLLTLLAALRTSPSHAWRHEALVKGGRHAVAAHRGRHAQRLACVLHAAHSSERQDEGAAAAAVAAPSESTVYFVMGGPGSGKGTQCARLVERYGMIHLSAGELLRQEVRSGSELGREISAVIDQGKIVASETTVRLLQNAMGGERGPFLIDGFPRSISNLEAFEATFGSAAFMLFLQVSESEMESRLLKRGATSGRSDDNRETIVKRFRTFLDDSMPVVDRLASADAVRTIDADASEEVVFGRVCDAFSDQDLEVMSACE